METHLADWLKATPDGIEAQDILRTCVHCGFCTATCPTYQLLGDELDGPRGRIYLIKQVVEGHPATSATQAHLDRCLTCRNCESTCPSGVRYGHLLDIGRKLVDAQAPRPLAQRLMRGALREGMTRRWLFDPAMRVGQALRPMLPEALRDKVPERRDPGRRPARELARKVLLLEGCVQPAMMPGIDTATMRVLDAIGVQSVFAPRAGCCGAIRHHLNDHEGGLADARRNLDAWMPLIDAGQVEALLINASGCGAMVKDYPHLLRHDPVYGPKAQKLAVVTFDLAQWLPRELLAARERGDGPSIKAPASPVVFHPPCTLQHGQQVRGEVERLLISLGVTVQPVADAHLCCGSAGTYSVLQPELSQRLRDRKLQNLQAGGPAMVLSANIGCIGHLQTGTDIPVRHWIEWLDQAMV